MRQTRMHGRLPVEAYLSRPWFDREQELLFGRTWQFAGLAEDLTEPGDYVTAQAGPFPLIVLRGEDGELRAFHNICRHRGTQLLRAVGKARKVITCPYHGFQYSLESGECLTAPEVQLQPHAVRVLGERVEVRLTG